MKSIQDQQNLNNKKILLRLDLNVPLKKFKTAVLVNRNHKKYPVKADFKGISLSTSLHEHVSVDFSENNFTTYLS